MWKIEDLVQVTREAGEMLKELRPSAQEIERKEGHANFVTACDRKIQEYLISRLSEVVPEAKFLGEEEGREVFLPEYREGYVFVLDPIDGTMNFILDMHLSVISVGLLRDGKPFIGVICNPYLNQCFWAEKGRGAFMNGERIHASYRSLRDTVVLMGTAPYNPEYKEATFSAAMDYYDRCADLRRSGTCAWDLCCVACGRAGLYYEMILGLWDYTAGSVILTEAGGKITDVYGRELEYTGKSSVLAVSPGVAKEEYLPLLQHTS